MNALSAILSQVTRDNTRVHMHRSDLPSLRQELTQGGVELLGVDLHWGELPSPGFAVLRDSNGEVYQILSVGLIN